MLCMHLRKKKEEILGCDYRQTISKFHKLIFLLKSLWFKPIYLFYCLVSTPVNILLFSFSTWLPESQYLVMCSVFFSLKNHKLQSSYTSQDDEITSARNLDWKKKSIFVSWLSKTLHVETEFWYKSRKTYKPVDCRKIYRSSSPKSITNNQ